MLQHPIEVLHYVRVREAHKIETFLPEPCCPALLVGPLAGVSIAVYLDDEPRLGTKEIGNEWAKPDLASEFMAVKLSGSQRLPQKAFGRRRQLSRSTNAFCGRR